MRLLTLLLTVFSSAAMADTHFHPLFTDNAILQRNTAVPVIVFSDQADSLTLYLDGTQIGKAKVTKGEWVLSLPAQQAGGPHTIKVSGDGISLSAENVFFGDVYLASGQSNMELPMRRVEEAYPADVAQADYPLIREFTVPDSFNFNRPQQEPEKATWKTAQADNIQSLSAIAFYFARHLYRYEGVPVGIVNASLGGSPIEAWMAPHLLKDYPEQLASAEPFKDKSMIEKTRQQDQQAAAQWYEELSSLDNGLQPPFWYEQDYNSDNWQSFDVPGTPDFAKNGFIGSWWARKTVQLPVVPEGPVTLRLGRIRDADEVWVNGVFIAKTTYHYPPRRYRIPAGVLREGDNVIAVRVTANSGTTEFFPDKAYFIGTPTQRASLAGEWQVKQAASMPTAAPVQTFIRWKPTGLYHAMIAPLRDFPLSGVLWYQGESNTGEPDNYAEKLVAMMNHWRAEWRQPHLPFFIVQLANYMQPQRAPEQSNWAQLQAQQAKAAATPDTYIVTTIDAGEYNDIHPVNKRIVGQRLAQQAQSAIYGRNVNQSGPQITQTSVNGNQVILSINDPDGLRNLHSEQTGFTLAGSDGVFYWADVSKDGNTYILSHDSVPDPTVVRYAWADNPIYSITDGDGWPLMPFELMLKPLNQEKPADD